LLLPKRLAARIVLSGMIIGALAGTASFALLAALKISGFASLGWTGVLTFFTGGAVLGLIGAFHFAHGRHDNHA
jgi:hypothetical protein